MSISLNQVENAILKLSASFDFKMDEELTSLWHVTLKDESYDEFIKICNNLMILTKRQWIDKFGFSSKPSIGDWLSFFNKTPLDFTEIALLECLQVIDIAREFSSGSPAYLFENQTTNAVIQNFGGLRSIVGSISTKDGYALKADLSFFKNDFQKSWAVYSKTKQKSQRVTGNIKKCINPHASYGEEIKFVDNAVVNVPDLSPKNEQSLSLPYFN